MGRIKTTLIKRVTLELIEQHKDKFSEDFQKNKEVIFTLLEGTKKMRNVVAGYVTRIMHKGDKFLMKSV